MLYMNTFKSFVIFLLCLFLLSCAEKKQEANKQFKKKEKNSLFSKMPSSQTGIDFINKVENKKDFNIFRYRNFYNGAGVGIGDIDNDGLPDVYLTSNMGENRLYRNRGNFEFENITETSGTAGKKAWSTGVTLVDINNDGHLDIYVSNAGNIEGDDRKNELFINNGDLTFTEKAAEYNLDENGFTTHAAFIDYDGDGDLDVYILNNSFIPVSSLGYTNKRELRSQDWNIPEIFKGGGDKLLKNNKGKFEDVSEEAGIYGSLIGFGLGVTLGDVNNDQLPDIYVSNDFYERDYLYINQGDGTFKEEIKDRISHLSLSSMGADMADINNDGHPEIFVTDMLPEDDERLKKTSDFERYDVYKLKESKDFYHQFMQNTLQLNNADDSFSEIAFYSGVAETDWSWGALIFDMDNDGYKDIYVSNGIFHDLTNQDFMDFFANDILQKMVLTGKKKEFDSILNKMPSTPIPNYAFENNGDLTFSNSTKDWGLEDPGFSNGSAYGDLDRDGDLDLIVNNVNGELFIYRNNAEKSGNNFLKVQLKGSEKNTFGIGSKVNLFLDEKVISQEMIPTRGFQSSVDYTLSFGLGEAESIDSLEVIWPGRHSETIYEVEVNKLLKLDYKNGRENHKPPSSPGATFLTEIDHQLPAHNEDNYRDYDYEGLISKMISREGPALAVADVNADGNDDIFIGGAKNQPAAIYLQNSSGDLKPQNIPAFEQDKSYEDTYAVFTDINGDGQKDLIVGSGGNFANARKKEFSTRIYFNEGNGSFSISNTEIPKTGNNTAVIAPYDFDKDGDVDLFIGSRSVPGVYGIDPEHQLLENDGSGNFKDVTEAKAFDLTELGMITDATWQDIDGDQGKELILTGEWMAPRIFKVGPNGLQKYPTNIEELSGAWSSLTATDLNNDGKTDLILGNRGTNSFYNPGGEEPVKMYINDFDDNGTIEQICTRPIRGEDVPVHLRRELAGQIASVKKQNLKFSEYAKKSIDELFLAEVLENSMVKEISTFKSLIAYNQGDGKFRIEELPAKAQFSSLHAGLVLEGSNGDPKLLLAGNDFNLKPQFSRLDANNGLVLKLTDTGETLEEPFPESGFVLRGQVRALHKFSNSRGEEFVIAAINNGKPTVFKINK